MNHEALLQRVNTLNEKSKKLNQQRMQNIGRKEALQKQLDTALSQYNEKYGTTLTVEGVDAELTRVASELEGQVANVESVITAIETGNYAEAERIVTPSTEGGTSEQSNTVTPTETPVVEQVTAPEMTAPEMTAPVNPVNPIPTPVAPVAPATPASSVQVPEMPTSPVSPAPTAPVSNSFLDGVTQAPDTGSVFTQSFKAQETPVASEEPVKPAPPSFSSILDGSQFQA